MTSSTSAASRVAVLKDFVNLLRDASLLVLVVMLLMFPGTFNEILKKAGFVEADILGFKWEAFRKTDTELQIANQTIGTLNFALSRAQSGTDGNKDTADLSQEVSQQAENVQKSLAQTLQNNAALLQPESEPTWVVVVAHEANKGDADTFIRNASKQIAEGFPGTNYKLCMAPIRGGGYGIGIYPPLAFAEAQSVRTALNTKRLLGRSDAWLNPSSQVSFQGC